MSRSRVWMRSWTVRMIHTMAFSVPDREGFRYTVCRIQKYDVQVVFDSIDITKNGKIISMICNEQC